MTQGLTFYKQVDTLYSLQVHQKRPICQTCDNTFIALASYLHPFIFTRDASSNDITSFVVKDVNDAVVETFDNSLVKIINAGAIDYIVCAFQLTGVDDLACDIYYYEIECDTETYYSEVFKVIDKSLDMLSDDIAVNGQFTTDLSDWTVDGATWVSAGSGRAQLVVGDSIAQSAAGEGLVEVRITTLNTYTQEMYVSFGVFKYPLLVGENIFYIPSGITYTITNENVTDANDLFIEEVQIYALEKVECYNLITSRNSCNKNSIPYTEGAYTDVFIIDAELYEPQYVKQTEQDENGIKDKSNTFIRIDKRWEMITLPALYEPMIDEINKLPANDTIYIFNDIWKKAFSVYQGTLDIDIQTEFVDSVKCNAMAKIIITENLAISNSCCEEITDLACCAEFGFELSNDGDLWTLTLSEPFCSSGVIYSLLSLDEGDGSIVTEHEFEDEITFDISIGTFNYAVRGSKFGCDDILYDVNAS